jgi:eukaryotic-like serine/threonine-protein kinase
VSQRVNMAGDMFSDSMKQRIERDPKFAVVYYKKESKRAERKYGADAPQALNLRQEYAVALYRIGQNEKAEAELAAVIARRDPASDVSDAFTRYAKIWHARVLYALGRFDEAETEWRELSAECDRLLGPHHPDAIEAHEEHAVTLARLDRIAEAETAGVVENRTAVAGRDDTRTLNSRTSQATYLDMLDRRPESEAAWRGLAEAKGRVLGSDHLDAIVACERLAVSLYAQRRPQEAADEYREVAALRAAVQGADHPDTKRARDWHATILRDLEGPDQPGTD